MKVELIDYMGSDDRVADSARVSFARKASDYTPEQNHKLIKYLAKHGHFTTFTHCIVTLAMTAPHLRKHTVRVSSDTCPSIFGYLSEFPRTPAYFFADT